MGKNAKRDGSGEEGEFSWFAQEAPTLVQLAVQLSLWAPRLPPVDLEGDGEEALSPNAHNLFTKP